VGGSGRRRPTPTLFQEVRPTVDAELARQVLAADGDVETDVETEADGDV
jgi:hypothetical protein